MNRYYVYYACMCDACTISTYGAQPFKANEMNVFGRLLSIVLPKYRARRWWHTGTKKKKKTRTRTDDKNETNEIFTKKKKKKKQKNETRKVTHRKKFYVFDLLNCIPLSHSAPILFVSLSLSHSQHLGTHTDAIHNVLLLVSFIWDCRLCFFLSPSPSLFPSILGFCRYKESPIFVRIFHACTWCVNIACCLTLHANSFKFHSNITSLAHFLVAPVCSPVWGRYAKMKTVRLQYPKNDGGGCTTDKAFSVMCRGF